MAAKESKIYTLEEVAKHNKAKDCWLVISGKVYDVTPFMDEHPGGDEVILSSTGKDATNDFEDVGHSSSARDEMEKLYIGEFDASSLQSKPEEVSSKHNSYPPKQGHSTTPQQEQLDKKNDPQFMIKILQFFVPLLVLALAIYARKYAKNE